MFTLEALQTALSEFLNQVPDRLFRHRETLEIARQFDAIRHRSGPDAVFTLAIVGPMKAGKSTLANALIGRDLVPTGVTETTVTLNRIRHGSRKDSGQFFVQWKNGRRDKLPLSALPRFGREGHEANQVAYLELFSTADLLEDLVLVDTPGTGSVDRDQDRQVNAFLGDPDRRSRESGGQADAILYALTPAARRQDVEDHEILSLFGERNRLPSAWAANSIAVIQHWETDPSDDYVEEAARARLRQDVLQVLGDQVGEVLVVSGLLAQACLDADTGVWDDLVTLANESTESAWKTLLDSWEDFAEEPVHGAALARDERAAVARKLPWAVIQFALRRGRHGRFRTGGGLRNQLWRDGNIEGLRETLHRQFLSVKDLVRGGTVLKRTDGLCLAGRLTLERMEAEQGQAVRERQQAMDAAQTGRGCNDAILRIFGDDLERTRAVATELSDSRSVVEGAHNRLLTLLGLLERDLECRRLLDRLPERADLSGEDREELKRLFGGANDLDMGARLGLKTLPTAELSNRIWDRLDYWRRRRHEGTQDAQILAGHAIELFQKLLSRIDDG